MKIHYILFAAIVHCTASLAQTRLPQLKHEFIVIAHRGDHVAAPENTIAAFENAIDHQVDFVEMDLRTTKDSVLVIMHDGTVDRTTNGRGKVSDLSYSEIMQLKIVDKRFSDQTKSYRVPSFEQVLQTCKNKINIYLDFKNADVQQAYNLVKKYGMERQVIVYINEPMQYDAWRRVAPEMPLMISLPENTNTTEALKKVLTEKPVALLDGDYTDYNPTVLQAALQYSIAVWPDIQSADEDKNWDKAIKMGFKGLQTDHPEALIAYLKNKGLR